MGLLGTPRMQVFPLLCPAAASLRIIAFVTDAASIQRLLGYLGEPIQAPPRAALSIRAMGIGKGGRWAQRPFPKKASGLISQPGRLNGRRRRGSGRLLEGNHAAQTAPAFALWHVPQRLEERAVLAVFDVAAHGVDHLGADIG